MLRTFIRSAFFFSCIWAAFQQDLSAATAPGNLTVQEILEKMLSVADQSKKLEEGAEYTCLKDVTHEELNSSNKPEKAEHKIYEVKKAAGKTQTKLIEENGKKISSVKAELENEDPPKKKKRSQGEKKSQSYIREEILNRFIFTLAAPTNSDSRNFYVLNFTPKPNQPAKEMADKFINRLAGTLWVDQEEFQLGRMEVRLTEKTTIFGGFVASIEQLEMKVERIHFQPNIWLNRSTDLHVVGRQLFSSVRMRFRELMSNYQPLASVP